MTEQRLCLVGSLCCISCVFLALFQKNWVLAALSFASFFFLVYAAFSLEYRRRRKHLERRSVLSKRNEILLREVEQTQEKAREQIFELHSRVSHSLRVPISIIQGYADLLRSGVLAEEASIQDYLAKISEQTAYMNDLLGAMLLEGRMQAELPAITKRSFDLLSLLYNISEDMSETARKCGIEIRIVSVHEDIPFLGDEPNLRRAFYNIIENALKYMGKSGIINITASRDDNEIMLIFKDNGNGLAPEETDKIFDQGYQGQNGRNGSGTGLYMTRLAVQAHSGSISARSAIGSGMGIYISLPSDARTASESAKNA